MANSRRGSEKKVIAYQPAKKVELNKAEVRWTRPVERLAAEMSSEEEVQTEELYRKFQGILNKLTPQKFQSLAEQALQLDINTEERLSGCIDKIFTKALEEPSFSIAYANLCKVMSPIKVEFSLDGGKTKKNTNFRRMLLTKCQTEFEKDKKDDETLEKMREGIKEAETKEKVALEKELSLTIVRMRKRSLGNIRFIGELFKLKMLSETIMHECITRLLKSSSDEEALECFGKLIMTTGKDLDHPEAKPRIDTYFRRMTEIIKKSKIPARIKFLLQDVQDMRDNRWVPRVRQDKQLKTIDQIHAEAKIEQEKEKEMIQQHQVVNYRGGGGGRDSRRGSKMGGDDWQGKGGGGGGDRGDRTKESREKFDHSKVTGILNRRIKEKTTQVSLGPTAALRPSAGAWKKGSGATTSAPQDTTTAKSAKPSRSSSSGTKRLGPDRGPGSSSSRGAASSGVKRASTTPEQEREAALQTVSQFTNTPAATPTAPPTKDAPAHAVRVERKPVAALLETPPPAPERVDEVKITRKTISIVDELVNNVDYKEAVECVRLMPKEALDVMVRESINHTLEKSSEFRVTAGKLFSKLVQDKVLTQQKFLAGLSDVLECAEDIAIDIPRIWSYLGEILAPVMSHSTLSLSLLNDVPPSLVESGGAAKLVAKVLQQCQKVSGSEEAVRDLWLQSRLGWPALGMRDEDLGEFLVDQDLAYLSEQVKGQMAEASYLFELQQILASDRFNGDVNDWIKGNCTEVGTEVGSLAFMRNLSIAIAGASVNGTGSSAIFNTELFEKRMDMVKGHITAAAATTGAQNLELGLQILNGLQVKVAQLSHPPKLFSNMVDILYNNDVLGEEDFVNWMDNGQEMFGRGNAVMSVSGFFKWLRAEEPVDQT